MGAADLTVRRWADLSGVERVGLYTRQSLYFVLWAFNGGVLLAVAFDGEAGDDAGLLLALGLAVVATAFAAMVAVLRRPSPRAARPIAVMLAAAGAYYLVASIAWDGATRGAAVAAAVGSVVLVLALLPDMRLAALVITVSGVLVGISGGAPVNVLSGLVLAASLTFTSRVSMWVLGVVTELDTARAAQAQLAVVEERLRFSRDVHDVLGRRLSTIAVQAELASTLAERGDERAAARMLEVRAVAHEALREARELARGYRTPDFPTELEGARSLLRSAGIEVRLDVDAMPRAWQEAAAWVVREAATNVLRHSRASVVEIAYAADGRLRIVNDGADPRRTSDGGAGLRGLRERLTPLGATLEAGPDGDDRWSVVAHLPSPGPLSARTRT